MQLINSAIYDEETDKRAKAIDKSNTEKAAARDRQQRQRVANYVNTLSSSGGTTVTFTSSKSGSMLPEIMVTGMRFQVVNGGSKLARVHGKNSPGSRSTGVGSLSLDPSQAHRVSPKSTKVGGVTFVRSKNGNLYRSGLVKAHV